MSSPERNNAAHPTQATELPVSGTKRKKRWLTVRETTVFAMLGALMFCSKLLLEWAPNIHLLALFLISFTLVYRAKALVPLYVFVLLTGVYMGFSAWWLPHLYIWLPLWGATMLFPRRTPKKLAFVLFVLLGALHGISYGLLWAPAQAVLFHLTPEMTLAWIASGLGFDLLHAVGNAAACTLVLPLVRVLCRLERRR